MKVVILAGGLGTRLAEETGVKPKPMVEIGGRPILWHILRHFAHHGHREFFIALGYKGELIKQFFVDYRTMTSDLTVRTRAGAVEIHDREAGEDWVVHLVDTGQDTQTGGRLKRLEAHLRDAPFMLTYGDGVCNVDLGALAAFHAAEGKVGTVTAVRPPARFGGLVFEGNTIREFAEKPQIGEGWINGGFMVLSPPIFDTIDGDATSLEAEVMENLSRAGGLSGYRHDGFWQCMDTLRELRLLERLWQSGEAPWKVWS